jgi:hypothetical protein
LWVFEQRGHTLVQRLDRLVALCTDCHAVQHAGRAEANGEIEAVRRTLCRANGWNFQEAEADLQWARLRYTKMTHLEFDLDLTLLLGKISVPAHPSLLIPAADRTLLAQCSWSCPRPTSSGR